MRLSQEQGVPAVVDVRELTKSYGNLAAVDGLSFTVPAGTVTAFLGPNGAGKSTTLRMLVGLIRPTSGSVRVLGSEFTDLPHPARQVGAVLDSSAFHPGRTGRDHLRMLATLGRISEHRVEAVLTAVGMTAAAARRVGGYSLGMKQRLALAAALLGDPALLLLDEPANGLDPEGIRWLRGFLRDLASDGKAVLVSSHALAEVAEIADRAVVIAAGRLVAEGSLAELARRSGGGVQVVTPRAEELAAVIAAAGGGIRHHGGELTVHGLTAAKVGDLAARHGIPVYQLTEQASLEDAFLSLTEGDKAAIR